MRVGGVDALAVLGRSADHLTSLVRHRRAEQLDSFAGLFPDQNDYVTQLARLLDCQCIEQLCLRLPYERPVELLTCWFCLMMAGAPLAPANVRERQVVVHTMHVLKHTCARPRQMTSPRRLVSLTTRSRGCGHI